MEANFSRDSYFGARKQGLGQICHPKWEDRDQILRAEMLTSILKEKNLKGGHEEQMITKRVEARI